MQVLLSTPHKCGFSSFKENVNKQAQELPKKEHTNIVLFKAKLNTMYSGTHDIYLEKLNVSSPRNSSPNLPRQRTEYFSEVILQSFNNGCTIRVIDVQQNRIDIDRLYSYHDLKHMQVKIIDPDSSDYAADCLVYAYEYINFLKENNIKYPYQELYVLMNAPNLENAYWNGYYLTFGNGIDSNSYAFVSPAIVSHELTHSLIQQACNLDYYGESGALNESYSDIIGVMFEFWLYEKHRGIGYELGSELYKDGHSMRSFIDPNKCGQPASTKDPLYCNDSKIDNKGVHINSGIINHLFWRLSQLTEKKITFDKFLLVFFKLKHNSKFNDFRQLLLSYYSDFESINIINSIIM